MERLERPSHPYPAGRLSPPKYVSSTEPLCAAGSKRDSAFSCFSSSSSTLVHDSSAAGRKGTSAENIFFKGLQSEGPQQNDRHKYLQPHAGNGGWEEQPASRVSISGRPSVGPVWQVPEKKKSQSPPPPAPPQRSDSFVATKVFPYSEGSSGAARSHGRSLEKLTERSQHLSQLQQNKLFSLSSSDVRQSHCAQPAHQRQYSDESPFYLQARAAPPTKTQSVGSYYRSLQDLPINAFSRKQVRHSTASMACSANPVSERHYSMLGKRLVQTADNKARHGKTDKQHWLSCSETGSQGSLKTTMKAKYPLPQSQVSFSDNKERSGSCHLGNGLHYDQQTYQVCVRSRSPEEFQKRGEGCPDDMKRLFSDHHSFPRLLDPWVPQEDHRISPLKTPLLHSLSQESRSLTERQPAAATGSTQDASDAMAASSGKANRRGDRYATTLRKEIQQKRAQLQKSRSAATLTCDAEDEEPEEWRSTEASASSAASFSNTYKDHLKEAQARVLQATSFQRRDLEPLAPEMSVLKTSSGRIRGRRRFHPAKRTHSFSEPDKIDKVGVDSSEEHRKLFEAKPAFSRPVLKMSHGSNLSTDLHEKDKPAERPTSGAPEEAQPPSDPNRLSPGQKQVLLEQQRLGTFAEYQATWTKQKKSSEAKTQGRYHSAENILDADPEEKTICIHERSRSSPSADFHSQVTKMFHPGPHHRHGYH